jgi:non-canonical purine NTP pyrophosphatase (RdgB/HAM1 family)
MKPKLLFATQNIHKREELARLLPHIDILMLDAAATMPEETGATFEGNALLKARAFAVTREMWVLADDSGLEVDALQGEPGVYSARYSNEGTDDANRQKVLKQLNGQSSGATMVSVMALVSPSNNQVTTRGVVRGTICDPRGTNGFGYDPIFFVAALNQTFGEVTPEEKSRVSHRSLAIAQLMKTELWRMFVHGTHSTTR